MLDLDAISARHKAIVTQPSTAPTCVLCFGQTWPCDAVVLAVELNRFYNEDARDSNGHLIGRPVSNTTYTHFLCRCDGCRAAHAAYAKKLRTKK